jgi:hypothetical protein
MLHLHLASRLICTVYCAIDSVFLNDHVWRSSPVSNVVKVADVPRKPGHFLLIKHEQALCLTFQTLHKLVNPLLQLCTTHRFIGLDLSFTTTHRDISGKQATHVVEMF